MRLRAASLAVLTALAATPWTALPVARADEEVPARPKIEDPNGVPVTFISKQASMEIFLAHGEVPARTSPDPFERVGLAPLTVKLAPGTYTIETASETTSTGHERFQVEAGTPITVEVHGGSSSAKTVGGILIALGVVATVLGVVALVSISPNDQNYNRWGIGLPLVIGGVAGASFGVGMTAIGSTDIRAPHPPPGGAARAVPAAAWVPSFTVRF